MPDSESKAKEMKRKFYHCGSHPLYSAVTNKEVQDIRDSYEGKDISAKEARAKILALQNRNRAILSAPGNKPVRLS
jgi:SpoVK/Ycf46/Vps4 family AAA+-type ATPase